MASGKGDFNLVGIPVWREIQITDSGLAGNSNHRYVISQICHYYLDSLLESFSLVMASSIVLRVG